MTDKTELPSNNDDASNRQESGPDAQAEVDGQDIFEQRFQELMGGFGELCEKHGVPLAIAMAIYPTPTDADEDEAERFAQPMVFFRGEMLESMSLAAEVLRNFKTQIAQSLDTDPR